MNDTSKAIYDLIDYLKQAEVRRTVGSDLAFNHFNDRQNQTKMRYQAGLESGDDQDFVDALESSPCPYPFVVQAMKERVK